MTTLARSPSKMLALRDILAKRESGVAIILALTIAIVSIINHDFLSAKNLLDILLNSVPALIVGCAMTLVIVTGEIDISVGSQMGFLAAVVGLLATPAHANWPVFPAILVTLAAGCILGAINGVLIAYARVPSIIVTLGMLTALRGITNILMQGEWITGIPHTLRDLGTLPPIPITTAMFVLALCLLITYHTPLGRRIYAVGSNLTAAPLAGLSPRRIKLFVFTFTGLLTAIATLVSVTRLSTIESGIGVNFELFVVTAVVVGGTSISGGKGTLLGSVLGVILLSIVGTALIFLKLGTSATYWERAIQGAFILIAVLADHLATRKGHQ